MKLLLIRHGATIGNLQARYVGITDEDITNESKVQLDRLRRTIADKILCPDSEGHDMTLSGIYVSPMKRALSTAAILFPEARPLVKEELRECDFGAYEYKNYEELKSEPEYQKFIDTMGEGGFPNGETKRQFQERCCRGYSEIIKAGHADIVENANQIIAIVAHGGTIMSILDRYSFPHRDYYDWQIKPGEGFAAGVDHEGTLTGIEKIN